MLVVPSCFARNYSYSIAALAFRKVDLLRRRRLILLSSHIGAFKGSFEICKQTLRPRHQGLKNGKPPLYLLRWRSKTNFRQMAADTDDPQAGASFHASTASNGHHGTEPAPTDPNEDASSGHEIAPGDENMVDANSTDALIARFG